MFGMKIQHELCIKITIDKKFVKCLHSVKKQFLQFDEFFVATYFMENLLNSALEEPICQHQYCTIFQGDKLKYFLRLFQIPNNLTQTAVRVPTDFDQFGGQGRDVEDKTSYERYLGTGAALLASLISSLYVVFSRYVSQREFVEPIVIAFYSGVIGLIIAVVLGPTVFDR